MPEVSVIIPVYNSEKYVEKCICSVMAQTLPELEIIIINDGSIDESGKILRKLAQKDSRIILLEQENKGVAAARNLGVEKATGKYLTFVDGDDYLQEDYIEKMSSVFQAYSPKRLKPPFWKLALTSKAFTLEGRFNLWVGSAKISSPAF